MAKLENIFFNRTLNQFLECKDPGGKKGLSLVEKLRESTDSNLNKVLATIAQVDDPHREALKQLCFDSVDGFSEDQFINGASKSQPGSSTNVTAPKAIDASKLYQRLHEPGAAVGDVIELLAAQKQFFAPRRDHQQFSQARPRLCLDVVAIGGRIGDTGQPVQFGL